jgi:hypothetical protein
VKDALIPYMPYVIRMVYDLYDFIDFDEKDISKDDLFARYLPEEFKKKFLEDFTSI